jgi:hypothetical protein
VSKSLERDSENAKIRVISPDGRRTKNIAYLILLISGLYIVAVTEWMLTANRMILPAMEILTVGAAVAITRLMVEFYRASGAEQKSRSLLALILTACMATVTITNHFLYLTVLTPMFGVNAMPSWLLLDGWPSLTKGLECVAWGFFLGLALLFAAAGTENWGSKAIPWTLRVSGVMTLAGLTGPLTGNMQYYILATIGYSAGFLVLAIELIVYLKPKKA